MLDCLSGFVTELRRAGLPVSLTEHLDAAEAIHHIPLEDREALKYALAATMVKSSSHWRTFETAFEIYFANRLGVPGGEGEGEGLGDDQEGADEDGPGSGGRGGGKNGRGGGGDGMTAEELAELLYRSIAQGNESLVPIVAKNAVTRFAGMEPGRP